MLKLKSLFFFVLIMQIMEIVFTMTIENYYSKGLYGGPGEEKTQHISYVKDVEQMKSDIEQLKKVKSFLNRANLRSSQPIEIKIKDQPLFDIRFDALPEKCQLQTVPSSCHEATACTNLSGYYHIKISGSNATSLVECDAHHEGGDWTIIQRRQDGSVDFYRTWAEYKQGFGDVDGEFFIGLDKLHSLTNNYGPQELLIQMVNGSNLVEGFAKFDAFQIGDESEKYVLKRTGRYSGTAGDALRNHIGSKFTTKDQDNDKHETGNCATSYTGAWWYTKCHSSNLNGHFGDKAYGKGINWYTFSTHDNSLQFVKMMLRRRRH